MMMLTKMSIKNYDNNLKLFKFNNGINKIKLQ